MIQRTSGCTENKLWVWFWVADVIHGTDLQLIVWRWIQLLKLVIQNTLITVLFTYTTHPVFQRRLKLVRTRLYLYLHFTHIYINHSRTMISRFAFSLQVLQGKQSHNMITDWVQTIWMIRLSGKNKLRLSLEVMAENRAEWREMWSVADAALGTKQSSNLPPPKKIKEIQHHLRQPN